jgi:hypothetical protein
MLLYAETNYRDPFDMELLEARWIIRDHGDAPERFTIARTSKKDQGGHLDVREYTVTVSRRQVPSVTYERADGRDWVVLFAHDLRRHRFDESPDRRAAQRDSEDDGRVGRR